MKKIKVICFLLLLSCFFVINVSAKEKVKIYFFHGDGCPHCQEETVFLKKLEKEYKEKIKIVKYEVWYNKNNQVLMSKVQNKMAITNNGVPLTIIGSTAITGYSESYGNKIKRAINYYLDKPDDYLDIVLKIKNGTLRNKKIIDKFSIQDNKSDTETTIKIPLIGNINLKDVSTTTSAVVIGLIDGFNPCALWVLIFLISMLIGMKNKKRMWILGVSFLVTSALVYMAIMLSWLNIVVDISTSIIFRNLIAVISIVGAILNFNSFLKTNDSGCKVVDDKKRKKILAKIKKFTHEKSFILALIGVISLAVSVNVIELACSAGLPLVFTQILAINKIVGFKAFIYTLVYIFFFLLDDLLIFVIAMATTKVTGISTKYSKYSHLIGGFIMLVIGILLIFKPEWLMFNFS